MGFKVYAFAFALVRWVALVALALIPTIIVVVIYRRLRGQPLWSLRDVPVAAEVTLCLAWLSLLVMSFETFRAFSESDLSAAVAAACFAAIPVMCGYESISALRRILGVSEQGTAPIPQPRA